MKFSTGFVVGIVCGVVACFLFLLVTGKIVRNTKEEEFVLLEKPSVCVTTNSLKVLQLLDSNKALVWEQSSIPEDVPDEMAGIVSGVFSMLENMVSDSQIMLLIGKESEHFYDNQVIKIPAKKCAKQIGTYKYKTKEFGYKTVPAVSIQ